MHRVFAIVCGLAVLLGVSGCDRDASEASAEAEQAQPLDAPSRAGAGEAEPLLSLTSLDFSIEDYEHRSVVDPEGGKPLRGHIGKLLCEGQEVALASHEFEDGFIITRDYGKLKIRFSPSLVEAAFAIWTTPEQEAALGELRKH